MTNGDIERYRVEAAIAAMHGLASIPYDGGTSFADLPRLDAQRAVEYADALMKELGLDRE